MGATMVVVVLVQSLTLSRVRSLGFRRCLQGSLGTSMLLSVLESWTGTNAARKTANILDCRLDLNLHLSRTKEGSIKGAPITSAFFKDYAKAPKTWGGPSMRPP